MSHSDLNPANILKINDEYDIKIKTMEHQG